MAEPGMREDDAMLWMCEYVCEFPLKV